MVGVSPDTEHDAMTANDDTATRNANSWRQEGPEAIARGLAPDPSQDTPQDEALWLALNAWA